MAAEEAGGNSEQSMEEAERWKKWMRMARGCELSELRWDGKCDWAKADYGRKSRGS